MIRSQKLRYLLFGLILLLALAVCRFRQTAASCPPPTADPNGYRAAICQYIRDNDIDVSPANPARYEIIRTELSERDGRSVVLVFLNCCYLGDVAILDAETSEVIDFRLGAQ
jgi:hypothetical protein